MWWPLRLRGGNDDAEKAMIVWLNSTLGIISLLSYRVPTEGSWVKFKKPFFQQMRCTGYTYAQRKAGSVVSRSFIIR